MTFEQPITRKFPISRDPPEGGTFHPVKGEELTMEFPISRDPPEGGTSCGSWSNVSVF